MKLELNFFTDSDGIHKVAITSPNCENGVVKELYIENYEIIMDTLSDSEVSNEKLLSIIEILAEECREIEADETLQLHAWRKKQKDGSNLCGIMAFINEGLQDNIEYSMIDISNNAYKKFRKGSTLQKLEIAYQAFEEQIKSGIFNH